VGLQDDEVQLYAPFGFPTLDQVVQQCNNVLTPAVVLVLKREGYVAPPPSVVTWSPSKLPTLGWVGWLLWTVVLPAMTGH
jgi:hypothetical protein